MVKHNQLNTLLMEILIVVLFFSLCSTVILDVFVGAHNQSARADEREDVLRQSGFFERGDGTWHLSCGAYDLLVTLGEEIYSAGTLETAEVTALENEQTIFTLPSARYVQGEVAP